MRVLVTGGAGFIGSHLCERLLKEGHEVTALDNLCTGRAWNILDHTWYVKGRYKEVKLIEADVRNPLELNNLDAIYHLASRASPKDFVRHSIDIMTTNSVGTENMLELARRNNARILIASTSEVYGEPLEHPQKEEYRGNVSTTGVRSIYDESKRFSEALAMAYHKRFNVDIRIARIHNTYGPRMQKDDGRAVPNFITQALDGEPLTIYGDGKQTRSMCYVNDMVDGLVKLMDAHVPDQMWYCSGLAHPTNLGNDVEVTMLELAKEIIALTKSKSKIVYHDLPEDDPTRRRPDISKAKALLGWSPKVSLKDGLRKTIDSWSFG